MVGMTAELEVLENSARRLQTAGVTRPVILLGQARYKGEGDETSMVLKYHTSDCFLRAHRWHKEGESPGKRCEKWEATIHVSI